MKLFKTNEDKTEKVGRIGQSSNVLLRDLEKIKNFLEQNEILLGKGVFQT
jgi:hypothetical protein